MLAAHERLDHRGEAKLAGLLRAGDPHGEVAYAWHANYPALGGGSSGVAGRGGVVEAPEVAFERGDDALVAGGL